MWARTCTTRLVIYGLALIMCSPTSCYAEDVPTRRRRRLLSSSSSGFYADTFGTNEDPPRYLYPGQEELEKMLTGDAETRRRRAALLPLRMACAMHDQTWGHSRVDDSYQLSILQTIVREKWKEALPLLAYGIQITELGVPPDVGAFFQVGHNGGYVSRKYQAGFVWLWLATLDMSDDEKIEFVLRVLKGAEPSAQPGMMEPLANAIDRKILRLTGKATRHKCRDELLAFLVEGKAQLATKGDVERAVLIGRILGKYLLFFSDVPEIEEYISTFSKTATPFNHVVALKTIEYLHHPRDDAMVTEPVIDVRTKVLDAIVNQAYMGLWHAKLQDPEVLRHVRFRILLWGSRPVLPPNQYAKVLFGFLKELHEDPDPRNAKELIPEILSQLALPYLKGHISAEVITYLEKMAADERYDGQLNLTRSELAKGPYIWPEELLDIHHGYTRARKHIDQILSEHRDRTVE